MPYAHYGAWPSITGPANNIARCAGSSPAGQPGPAGRWVLASIDREPVGMLGVTRHETIGPADRYLEYLWVTRAWRRSGVGSAFINKVAGELRGDHAAAVWLWVLDTNTSAQKLYEDLGFRSTGVKNQLCKDPAAPLWEVQMKRDLSPVAPA